MFISAIARLYRGNGKGNGNYYIVYYRASEYGDNGKEHGNYYLGFWVKGFLGKRRWKLLFRV